MRDEGETLHTVFKLLGTVSVSQVATMPTTDSTTAATTIGKTRVHGHCDLCWGRDGFREMKLLTCPDCGVAFHCECYGVDTDSSVQVHNQAYPCGACRAVGETFTGRDHTGREHVIQQTERPTECCLCSVDEGIALPHPMHPLYDNHGESGKQIALPPDKKTRKPFRLAWVHTLCAMSISSHSSTGGCVYGCDANGKYKDAAKQKDIDIAIDDDNPDASKKDQTVHHFVFCRHKEKRNDAESRWAQTIRERQELKCTLCGANDRNDGANVSYRIPVQCSANDPAEFKEFKGAHDALRGGRCFVPVHVGCAQWHKNDAGEYPSVTRVYFFPGKARTSELYTQPVINIFCDLHARDLQIGKKTESTIVRHPGTGKVLAQAKGVKDKEIRKPPEKVAARAANTKPPPSVQMKVAAKGTAERKMPAIKKVANKRIGDRTDQHALAPEANQHDTELCRKMVQDLVQNYRPLKNNKQRNRVRVARECYWKRQSNMSSEEFREIWGIVKERTTQELATEETMTADRTTGENVPAPDSPSRKQKSSKISKAVAVDYPGDLEKHRELGDAMFRNAVIAMENMDTTDGAVVKAKMSEIRKSSKKSAKGLTVEKFKELWYRVKNAVAEECGFRYVKPADSSAGSIDGAADQAGVGVGPEDAFSEQQPQTSLPPPSGDDAHGQLVEASSAMKSSTDKGKGTGTTDRRTEKIPEPQVVAERNDTREKPGAQGGLRSEVTQAESAEASNASKKSRLDGIPDTRENQGAQGIRSGVTAVKVAEPLNAPNKRRLRGVSDTREAQGAQGVRSEVTEVESAEVSKAPKKRRVEGIRSEITAPSKAPKKRRLGGVSESKLPDYDINQKEQWYHKMVAGIQEAIMKPNAVGTPGALENILAEHKKRWMKQLGIPNSEFRAIWEKVIQKSTSFKATPIPTTKKDWSFLVVGKNYNPDGIDFKTWDTYEEIASDPEE
jgi:hypothetical protein